MSSIDEFVNFVRNQKIYPQTVKGLEFRLFRQKILKIHRATEMNFAWFILPNVCFLVI